MKTLDDVKAFLEGQENGIEMYEAISNAILHERSTGKGIAADEKRKVESMQKALKKLGFSPDEHELDSFIDELSKETETGRKSKSKLTDSERRLLELEKKFDAEVHRRMELETKNKHSTIKSKLLKEFSDKMYSAEDKAKILIMENRVDLAEDGKSVIWRDGDSTIDFETGLSSYYNENKSDMKNSQKGGANGSSGDSSSGGKIMPFTAFDKLGWTERSSFLKDGGKITE